MASMTINGVRHPADEDAADVIDTVRSVAQVLALCGERLRAGDRILAGSLTHLPIGHCDHITAEIEGLGCVSAHIR
jgi:2-keto-4-pentenoate hydratase